jgi:hypothetical protein
MKEAFVYIWYDALNKMYYLGKHKGSPDDKYTHSSTVWESFTKDNIPEGVTRRILAYGTDEEICLLEHELLKNRKKRCWDRYYNNSLGDPRYVDMSGENNPMYGKMSELAKKQWQDPEYRKMMKEQWQDPEFRKRRSESTKKLWQDPEFRKMQSDKSKKQWQDPEFRKKHSESNKKRWQDPEFRKIMKKLWQDPEFRKMQSESNKGQNNPMSRENRAKRKAENFTGAVLPF